MNDESIDEDLPMGLTSAPLADAVDQAWISGLLGSLRETPAAIPPEIAARLDQVLAAEQRVAGSSSTSEDVLVEPARSRNTRWLAIAAAALVFVGGASIYRQATSTGGSEANTSIAAGDTAKETAGAAAPENSLTLQSAVPQQPATDTKIIVAADQTVTKTSVATTVSTLLAASAHKEGAPADNVASISAVDGPAASTGGGAGGSAGGSTGSSSGAMGVASTAGTTSTALIPAPKPTRSPAPGPPWNDCLAAITGARSNPVQSVITGVVFEGRSADILVRPVMGDPQHLDLWVVEVGCTSIQSVVLDHQVITAIG